MTVRRAAVEEYGLWDQLRVDHGREFYLLLFVQEKIRRRFGSSGVLPYIQTRSTEVTLHLASLVPKALCGREITNNIIHRAVGSSSSHTFKKKRAEPGYEAILYA